MKKSLLFIGLALSVAATAQNKRIQSTGTSAKAVEKTTVYPEVYKAAALPAATPKVSTARHGNGSNNTSAVTEVTIGSSGNCLGPAFGPKTNLWYDKDINTVTFTHRTDNINLPYPNSGLYVFDGSTNGGSTWTINNYLGGDSTNVNRGRYPHGVIYNPQGNTDPNNAFVTAIGPSNDGATSGFCDVSWNGLITGNAPVSGTSHVWTYESCTALGLNTLIPSGGTIVKNTGTSYFVVNGYDGTVYNDTVCLIKGTWNSTTSAMDYTYTKLYVPVCTDDAGAKMFVDVNTAWNDAGDIGYITVLGNDWSCGDEPADSTYGLIVWKTADGGATWTKLGRPWLSLLDPVLAAGDFFCTSAFEHDVVVDKNNNLHVAVAVGAYAGGGSISTGPGFWALFDISTPDQGASWTATVVGRPMTFRGTYGDPNNAAVDPAINEDSRPQISRSWDGSKVFFSWFDTDTIIFGSGGGNIFPDMFSIGLDVDAELWTNQVNHTQNSGTQLDGASHFGNICYYTINNGTDECIPMVGGVMVNPPISTGSPLTFDYIAGACMSNYTNSFPLIPLDVWIGTNDPKTVASAFSVSSNYPNPYTGKTSVDVTLAKASDVTIEISNAVGQVISTENYKNLHSGVNTLTINGSSLSKGLYFYTVRAGSEFSTKTMSVE